MRERPEMERDSLRGIDAMGVIVRVDNPAFEHAGFDTSAVAERIRCLLRDAGIRIPSDVEVVTMAGRPIFVLDIETYELAPEYPGVYSVAIRAELRQWAYLERVVIEGHESGREPDREEGMPVITWERVHLGVLSPEQIGLVIAYGVPDLVKRFIADLYVANGQEAPRESPSPLAGRIFLGAGSEIRN